MRPFRPVILATIVLLAALRAAPAATTDDASFEFSKTTNPSGDWRYGWASAPGGAFQPFTTELTYGSGLARWYAPNGASLSQTCAPLVNEAGVTMLGGVLSTRLGSGGAATILRWTAPSSDSWHARATFVSEAGYFPLPTSAHVVGTAFNSGFANAVAVGDVNGDGYADVLVGEPAYTNGQTLEGRAELFLGGPSGPSSTPVWSLESNVASLRLGTSVAMGDFNHDGFMDFVVCGSGSGAVSGRVFLYRGSPGPISLLMTDIVGTSFGASCCFGDFNGDGYADLAVLWPATSSLDVWNGTAGAVSSGPSYGVSAGLSTAPAAIADAGDTNGDGIDDLLIGAPLENTGDGVVRLALGSTVGIPHPGTPPGVVVSGSVTGGQFGAAVAAAGDVDGDGYRDFLVGSPAANFGGSMAGRVQLFRGSSSGAMSAASWTADGASGSQTGTALCPLGDLNGDGHSDFAVGAPNYANGQVLEGAALIYYGNAGATATLHSTRESNVDNWNLGRALAIGDVNGDGLTDLATGAPGYKVGLNTYGRVEILLDPGPPPVPFARTMVRIRSDGVTVAQDSLDTATGRDTVTIQASLAALAGHTLDFEVADAGGIVKYEAVAVDAEVEPDVAPSNPIGPALVLGDQRFVPISGPPAFEAAAFDPLARQFASNGHLYDVCNNLHSNGPDGPGIAWDLVTKKFWNLSFDAGNQRWIVSSWDTVTQTLTQVFTIPRVLNVPGTGADTLEDARGIATDSAYVYIVDSGPTNLVPAANAWFKFTRAGVAVASRKGAAFAANATYDIVDDIVYSPFASPTAPGRLLVAIEHVGILALDTDGALRDSATWRAQGLPRANSPTGFAGLALDPVSGDLFIANNDQAVGQRWVRLPSGAPASYLIGDNDPAVLLSPVTECTSASAMLLETLEPKNMYCPVTPFIFGVALRTADQRVYAVDYSSGTLWKFDPRGGRGARVGETGVNSMWGLAYDPQRDRLYGLQNAASGASQVWSIHPRTAVGTALPQQTPYALTDIAFEPTGGLIYGVTGGPARLIRINRDTGAGTVVGPTRYVSGIEWDPGRGALVGMWYDDSLYSINAGTGAASLIAKLPWSVGWEGLAIGTVGLASTLDAPRDPTSAGPSLALALAVAPQPSRERATLTFALSAAAEVKLDVYDVTGRHVCRVAAGPFAPGAHAIAWDGRDDSGGSAPAGVYFVRLAAGARSVNARVVRVR